MRVYVLNESAQRITNDESNILKSEDDNQYVDIYLYSYSNDGIEFKTPSDRSTTDYASRKLHIRPDEP